MTSFAPINTNLNKEETVYVYNFYVFGTYELGTGFYPEGMTFFTLPEHPTSPLISSNPTIREMTLKEYKALREQTKRYFTSLIVPLLHSDDAFLIESKYIDEVVGDLFKIDVPSSLFEDEQTSNEQIVELLLSPDSPRDMDLMLHSILPKGISKKDLFSDTVLSLFNTYCIRSVLGNKLVLCGKCLKSEISFIQKIVLGVFYDFESFSSISPNTAPECDLCGKYVVFCLNSDEHLSLIIENRREDKFIVARNVANLYLAKLKSVKEFIDNGNISAYKITYFKNYYEANEFFNSKISTLNGEKYNAYDLHDTEYFTKIWKCRDMIEYMLCLDYLYCNYCLPVNDSYSTEEECLENCPSPSDSPEPSPSP